MVFTATKLNTYVNGMTVADGFDPTTLTVSVLKATPDAQFLNSSGDVWSTGRLMTRGLKVIFPAPAPVEALPMLSVCSTSREKVGI